MTHGKKKLKTFKLGFVFSNNKRKEIIRKNKNKKYTLKRNLFYLKL